MLAKNMEDKNVLAENKVNEQERVHWLACDRSERQEFCSSNYKLFVVMRTNTLWTILANRAVAVNPDLNYDVVQRIMATSLKDAFANSIGAEADRLVTLVGLAGVDLAENSKIIMCAFFLN